MLAAIRIFILGLFFIFAGVFGSLFCLLRPFHRNNTSLWANIFGSVHPLLGLKLEIRVPDSVKNAGPSVFIANHQNSWDIFTLSRSLLPGTVSVGKKSLKWVPFFGQLYWLAGNILIDRKNSSKAHGTIAKTVSALNDKRLSIWLFPEGTRNYGRGLLPFKTGAFHSATGAKVPMIPVCMSTTHNQVKLNRWNNGKIIIEMLPPVDTSGYSRANIRELMATVYESMRLAIERIDKEAHQEKEA